MGRCLRALGVVLLDNFEVTVCVTVVVDSDVEDACRPVAARLRRRERPGARQQLSLQNVGSASSVSAQRLCAQAHTYGLPPAGRTTHTGIDSKSSATTASLASSALSQAISPSSVHCPDEVD